MGGSKYAGGYFLDNRPRQTKPNKTVLCVGRLEQYQGTGDINRSSAIWRDDILRIV